MHFLIDAQLPPSLAAVLRQVGHEATHVSELDLLTAKDSDIWDAAASLPAVLVTKDRDFSLLHGTIKFGPAVLWIRTGNIGNQSLIEQILSALPSIVDAIERGEAVIEFPKA